MCNPYDLLYIYYFDTIPDIGRRVQECPHFLGVWEEENVAFVFFSAPSDEWVQMIIKKNKGIHLVDTYEMTGEQWHGDKIEPYFINDLYIHPPWHLPEDDSLDIKKIVMDPGVVFGTGRHQTTEDCLYLMHRLFVREDIRSVLDISAPAQGCYLWEQQQWGVLKCWPAILIFWPFKPA